ncbi:MAG: hypothetical protein PHQ23_10095, partial [Candidatus Wallbacteria bacterium]|nr:hypothetical protein [Candidatus Wallbacteria bacterium]
MGELDRIREAGIIGGGGAGFPTYFKLSAKAEVVIANGAECEPLLASDQFIMTRHPDKVLSGLLIAKKLTGASRAVIALKKKYECFTSVSTQAAAAGIDVFGLDNFYPAGDEQVLTYEV